VGARDNHIIYYKIDVCFFKVSRNFAFDKRVNTCVIRVPLEFFALSAPHA